MVVPSVLVALINFVGLFTATSGKNHSFKTDAHDKRNFAGSGERGDKITLGLTTLLAMAVILLQVEEQVPRTSVSTPMIGNICLVFKMLSYTVDPKHVLFTAKRTCRNYRLF